MTQMLQQLAQRHECDGMHGLIARARDLHARNFGVHHVTQRRLDQDGGAFHAIAGTERKRLYFANRDPWRVFRHTMAHLYAFPKYLLVRDEAMGRPGAGQGDGSRQITSSRRPLLQIMPAS